MQHILFDQLLRRTKLAHLFVLTAASAIFFAMPGQAAEFEKGQLSLDLYTTVSYGLTWRVEDPDSNLIGLANGGRAFSVNGDDGNLNYDTGVVSNVAKITSELELKYRNFGAFFRGSAFYDFESEDGDRERTPLTEDALDRVGKRIFFLDAYLWSHFEIGDRPVEIRLGEQVVSWGESTFIQNSINVINSVDVSAIRLPGSELREALLPEGMVFVNLGLSENTSLELLYLYDWQETEIDPPGSYFATSDFAGDGGTHVFLGSGSSPDLPPFPFFFTDTSRPFLAVPRERDRKADSTGQYGAALRWFVPSLNGTEFGFYFLNYHSRLPIVNGRTGTLAGAGAAAVAGPAAAVAVYQALGVAPGTNPLVDAQAAAAGQAAGLDAFASTAGVFLSFEEDIQLYGISFNTMLGEIAVQGEVSYRKDVPLQVDDVELLFAALSPTSAFLAANNQLGAFGFDQEVPGFIERDVTQVQATVTKLFGPVLGADQGALVWEGAVTHVNNMPAKNTLRLDGPGTFVSGNPILELAGVQPATESAGHFADATSWGYRLAGSLDYNGAIGAINLTPRFSFQHDVHGVSPGPGGNFIEGRKAITVGLRASYQNTIEVDVSYTSFFGASRYNLINDRDFVGLSFKYSL